jgi:CheY-like chemotaxis protein
MLTDLHYNIILVDDDFTVNYFNKIVLEDAGITERVHDFTSPIEALRFIQNACQSGEFAKQGIADIIFIDINMPEMDGFEFIEQLELTCKGILQEAALCMLSSSEHARDKKRAQELGVCCYYSKPLDEKKISDIIKILQLRRKN